MAFKPNNQGIIARGYHVGENSDKIIYQREKEKIRKKEEAKFGPERDLRVNYNSRIAKLIIDGCLDDEILAIIHKEFPSISPSTALEERIRFLREQLKCGKAEIDDLIEKVRNMGAGEIFARDSLYSIIKRYNLFAKTLNQYYKRKMQELGDDQR